MKRPFAATVWREGNSFVSQCLAVDVASQGETEEEAFENLREVLDLYYEPPCATRPPAIRIIEAEVGEAEAAALLVRFADAAQQPLDREEISPRIPPRPLDDE